MTTHQFKLGEGFFKAAPELVAKDILTAGQVEVLREVYEQEGPEAALAMLAIGLNANAGIERILATQQPAK